MDYRSGDLWRGGPWERPASPAAPPPSIPTPARPALRVRRRRRRRWPAFVGLASLILAICLSLATLKWLDQPLSSFSPPDGGSSAQQQEYSTDPPSIPRAETGTGVTVELLQPVGQVLDYTQIYQKASPSIVSIEAESTHEYSTGTGIILTADGYIITNAHVVAGAREVIVSTWDNQSFSASLVGFDAREDLAVLKVAADGLTPAEFGDSSALVIGEAVAAIGDPLGYRSTITDGIISALDREVDVDGVTMTLIQTSAAINFGNSGGALINRYGQVVGITTIKIVTDDGSAEALGFAIPSRRVKYVADSLIDGQGVEQGVFGFTVLIQPVSGGGLTIRGVDPGSDAWAKGIRAGDVLLEADGQTVTGIQDLIRMKLSLGAGDTVTLTLLRGEDPYTVEVALVSDDALTGKEETG